jgi:hypothetical protein
MSKYDDFIFKSYSFDKESGVLDLCYGYDQELTFHEIYQFNFDFIGYDSEALDRAIQLLFFVAGVSYFKMYLSPNIKIEAGQIDQALASFLGNAYEKGLGEFFYVNGLDPATKINFPVNSDTLAPHTVNGASGQLIGLGGGKDSLLSLEVLREQPKVATWSLNHRSQLEPLVDKVGLTHFWVEREWDPLIMKLNAEDALNGHIPISAIFSAVGLVVAVLSGYQDVVVSNESSASEPSLSYNGIDINHQYSKSLEYEKNFQMVLSLMFGDSLRYYSLLRPLSELRIAEYFAAYFDKYSDVFSSCNRAFTFHSDHMFWCGECAKCAFVFLILTPFVDKDKLTGLWQGKNLLLDPDLEPMYKRLLGIEGDKPLDCVGEVKEARAAMRLAKNVYPELSKYVFSIPEDYDYKTWREQTMPDEVLSVLKSKLA